MGSFLGAFADLTGLTVGPVKVLQIAGRDRQKAPLWECECQSCFRVQTFGHVKLVNRQQTHSANEALQCQNRLCNASRSRVVRSETLADVQRAERRERERAERIANEQREYATKVAAKRLAEEAQIAPLRKDWHQYVRNRIKCGIAAKDIMNFDRWLQMRVAVLPSRFGTVFCLLIGVAHEREMAKAAARLGASPDRF